MNNRFKGYTIFCLMVFTLFSCDTKKAEDTTVHVNTVDESVSFNMAAVADKTISYVDYINWYYSYESGMMINRELNGLNYSITIKNPLVRKIESALKNKQSDIRIDSAGLINEFPDLHFMMKIELPDKRYLGRLKANSDINEYLAFSAESDFFLIANQDTIRPNLYHYENVYPHVPYLSFLLSFSSSEFNYKSELFFVFQGDSAGIIKTKIPVKVLNFIPKFNNL